MLEPPFADRLRVVRRSDRGDAPPEVLITISVVAASAAVVAWLTFGDRFGAVWWMAIPLAAMAVLSAGVYVLIKAQDVVDAARRRRTHGTGE